MINLKEEVEALLTSTTSNILTDKRCPDLLERMRDRTSYLLENCKITERIYHILYDIYQPIICEHPDCNNILRFGSLGSGYRKTCSNKCGVYVNKLVKLEKYGDENYNNIDKMLQTKIDTDSYTQMVKTHKATCLEKYGVEHHNMVAEIQDKTKLTNIEKYGVENVFQYQPFIDIIKEKTKLTNIERYGVEYYAQTGLNLNGGYKWKEYQTPDNNILKIQGYEHYLLDELFKEYGDEIVTERRNMPEFWYIGTDDKTHRYFPDVYVPSTNTIYEVKSDYTLNVDLETNNLKFQAVKDAGFNFVLKVY